MELKYPNMQADLIYLLTLVATAGNEPDEWKAFPMGFNECINLIDDVLPVGAEEGRGWVLYDEDVEPVSDFLAALDSAFATLGGKEPWRAYRQHPTWVPVEATANAAVSAMRAR